MATNATINKASFPIVFTASCSGRYTTLITVVVVIAGALWIPGGSVSITDLITFLLYINVFTEPVKTLIDFTEQFHDNGIFLIRNIRFNGKNLHKPFKAGISILELLGKINQRLKAYKSESSGWKLCGTGGNFRCRKDNPLQPDTKIL